MKRYSTDPIYRRLIVSERWRRLRAQVLHEHPLCQHCEREGYITSACEVHHKVPVDSAPTGFDKERLMFDRDNLEALCSRCHREAHRTMGKGTKEEQRRRVALEADAAIKKLFGEEGGGIFKRAPGGQITRPP